MPTYETLRAEYAELWASMKIRPEYQADVDAAAQRVLAGKSHYQAIEAKIGVPWPIVGIIHMLECGCRIDRHLHNGDPLTARTVHVPRGRPATGTAPYTWEESAIDALKSHNLHAITDWSIPRIAYELERYNGFGYRRRSIGIASPYLWSKTNHYRAGKFISDGKWSAAAVSGQSGGMAILRVLMALEPSLAFDADGIDDAAAFPKAAAAAVPSSMATSTTGNAAIANGGLAAVPIAQGIGDAIAKTGADGTFTLGELALNVLSSGWFWTGAGMLLVSAYIWLRRRNQLVTWGV